MSWVKPRIAGARHGVPHYAMHQHRRRPCYAAAMTFQIKRAYEPASPKDGARILVDRLWPRGLKKSDAELA